MWRRWIPRGAVASQVTGAVVDYITNAGREAPGEIIRFHETVAFIVTLLLVLIYPTFQYACDAVGDINSHVRGLGTGLLAIGVIAVVADFCSSLMCIVTLFLMYCTRSTEEAMHLTGA